VGSSVTSKGHYIYAAGSVHLCLVSPTGAGVSAEGRPDLGSAYKSVSGTISTLAESGNRKNLIGGLYSNHQDGKRLTGIGSMHGYRTAAGFL